ncbi:MAG: hypothetical protein ACUVSP_07365 [Desulfotomaculales bacterium]
MSDYGIYYLKAYSDGYYVKYLGNNPPPPPGKIYPDYAVTQAFSSAKNPAAPGDKYTANFLVQQLDPSFNSANTDVRAAATVNGQPVYITQTRVVAGGARQLSFEWTVPPNVSSVTLRFTVNGDRKIDENGRYGNNERELTVPVKSPDLSVSDLNPGTTGVGEKGKSYTPSARFTNGYDVGGSATVRFYKKDAGGSLELLHEQLIGIQAGQTVTVACGRPWTMGEKSVTITATINLRWDGSRWVEEAFRTADGRQLQESNSQAT